MANRWVTCQCILSMQQVLLNLMQFSYCFLILLLIIYNIHIALVAETWFVSIDNYTLFHLDRNPTQKRKGGGICFYVRKDVKCSIIKHHNITDPNLEYMFISCEFASTAHIIACIYHPPKPHYDTGLLVYELSADLDNLLSTNCDSVYFNR